MIFCWEGVSHTSAIGLQLDSSASCLILAHHLPLICSCLWR
jgi:hypothetical protein